MKGLLSVCLLLIVSQVLCVDYTGHQVLSITVREERVARELIALTEIIPGPYRLWTENVIVPGEITIQTSQEGVNRLRDYIKGNRLDMRVVHSDLQQAIDELFHQNNIIQNSDAAGFFDSYATFDQMQQFLQDLNTQYPTLTSLVNVGTTVEGRPITGIVISGPGSNPTAQIVINACQHAREWITPMTAAYIAQAFCQNYTKVQEVTDLINAFEWTIIPIVNGDGYVYTWTDDRMWRKNRRTNPGSPCYGVDINRNWGYQWGTGGSSSVPCTDTYKGPSAFSEPEETAVANYISGKSNVVAYIDLHSYGDLFMYPWGYTCDAWVSNNMTQNAAGEDFASAVYSVHQQRFTVGPTCQTIYQASGGSNDWTYGGANVPYSFAAELRGNSFVIPPDNIIPSGQEIFAGVQAWATYIQQNQ